MDDGSSTDERIRTVPTVLGLTIAVLIIALLPWDVGFYTLVRLLVTAGVGWVVFAGRTFEISATATIALIVVGIVYNPIVPVYVDRSLWVALDIVSAGSLVWVWVRLRDNINSRM